MKAKMAKLCLLFILLCSLPVFYSCSDEADAFYLYEYWEVMFDPEPPNGNAIVCGMRSFPALTGLKARHA